MVGMTDLGRRLVDRFDLGRRGSAETGIEGVRLFYYDRPVPRGPLLYTSGIIILLSGRKIAHLGARRFSYDCRNYLALGLPLAMECETDASVTDPMFALYVAVDPAFLRDVAQATGLHPGQPDPRAPPIAAAPLDDAMGDAIQRMMTHLLSPGETSILGEGVRREIVYRAFQGPAGGALRGLLSVDGQTARVAEVMQILTARHAERLRVDDLAQMAGMSPAAFYRAFKTVTDDTPLQYLKKVRLSRASTLIVHEGYRIGAAAMAVGYESPAQFSRDFKAHFGVSAAEAKRHGHVFVGSDPAASRAIADTA